MKQMIKNIERQKKSCKITEFVHNFRIFPAVILLFLATWLNITISELNAQSYSPTIKYIHNVPFTGSSIIEDEAAPEGSKRMIVQGINFSVKDRFGVSDGARTFIKEASLQFSYEKSGVPERTTLFWTYIGVPSPVPSGESPLTGNRKEIYNYINGATTNTPISGMARYGSTIGVNRYVELPGGLREPWYLWAYSPTILDQKGWYFVAHISARNYSRIYLFKPDGRLSCSYNYMGTQDPITSTTRLTIGSVDGANSIYTLDDFSVAEGILTLDQIIGLYNKKHDNRYPIYAGDPGPFMFENVGYDTKTFSGYAFDDPGLKEVVINHRDVNQMWVLEQENETDVEYFQVRNVRSGKYLTASSNGYVGLSVNKPSISWKLTISASFPEGFIVQAISNGSSIGNLDLWKGDLHLSTDLPSGGKNSNHVWKLSKLNLKGSSLEEGVSYRISNGSDCLTNNGNNGIDAESWNTDITAVSQKWKIKKTGWNQITIVSEKDGKAITRQHTSITNNEIAQLSSEVLPAAKNQKFYCIYTGGGKSLLSSALSFSSLVPQSGSIRLKQANSEADQGINKWRFIPLDETIDPFVPDLGNTVYRIFNVVDYVGPVDGSRGLSVQNKSIDESAYIVRSDNIDLYSSGWFLESSPYPGAYRIRNRRSWRRMFNNVNEGLKQIDNIYPYWGIYPSNIRGEYIIMNRYMGREYLDDVITLSQGGVDGEIARTTGEKSYAGYSNQRWKIIPVTERIPFNPIANHKYSIRCIGKGGKGLSIWGDSKNNNGSATCDTYGPSASQKWMFVRNGNTKYYYIKNNNSGRILSCATNGKVTQVNNSSSARNLTQTQWYFFDQVAGEKYKIINRKFPKSSLNGSGGTNVDVKVKPYKNVDAYSDYNFYWYFDDLDATKSATSIGAISAGENEELSSENSQPIINVHPVPFDDFLYITTKLLKETKLTLKFYDINAQLVTKEDHVVAAGNGSISLKDLKSKGIQRGQTYVLVVSGEGKIYFTQQIVAK